MRKSIGNVYVLINMCFYFECECVRACVCVCERVFLCVIFCDYLRFQRNGSILYCKKRFGSETKWISRKQGRRRESSFRANKAEGAEGHFVKNVAGIDSV